MIKTLGSLDGGWCYDAITHLGAMSKPGPKALAAMIDTLNHKDMQMRWHAAKALQRIGARPRKPPTQNSKSKPIP